MTKKECLVKEKECLVKKAGQVDYFSHGVLKKYAAGEIEFVDEFGRTLKPSYFGAGLYGLKGTLLVSNNTHK